MTYPIDSLFKFRRSATLSAGLALSVALAFGAFAGSASAQHGGGGGHGGSGGGHSGGGSQEVVAEAAAAATGFMAVAGFVAGSRLFQLGRRLLSRVAVDLWVALLLHAAAHLRSPVSLSLSRLRGLPIAA